MELTRLRLRNRPRPTPWPSSDAAYTDVFDLDEVVDAVLRSLTADSRGLDPTERSDFGRNDPRVRAEMMRSLAVAGGYHGMVGGQMIDLVAETTKMDVNGITRLQQLKTGALICFSAEAGAILGRADTVKRHALRYYAHDMGLAFQIADDLLDVVGDEMTLGKTPGKDAKAGKATLVAALGEERARTQAEMLTAQAIGHLEPFGEQAALLRALAQFAINRNK